MKDDIRPGGSGSAFMPIQPTPTQTPPPQNPLHPPGSFTPHTPPDEPMLTPPHHHVPQQPHYGRGPKAWWRKFKALPRNKKIMVVSALIGFLIALGGLLWFFVFKSEPAPPPPPPVAKEEEVPVSDRVPSPLTGVLVGPKKAAVPVTGVMIENSPDARPQAGLYQAGVVFEAIAEGGITRFLTLFQETSPEYIGPVRSVRPYYLDFLVPHDAPIAHAGGSAEALAQVRAQGIKDLEAFQNPAYYQRVSNRIAPHNLYTGRSRLLELQKRKGWTKSKFTGFARKEQEEKAKKPTARIIDFKLSGYLYDPHFAYDAKTNSYKRSQAGQPHMDERAKKQIKPKVVIALAMAHQYAGIYSVYGAKGSGEAFFFQDGIVKKGRWKKPNRKTQFTFTDKHGEVLKLNAGQTWVTIVNKASAVSYKP